MSGLDGELTIIISSIPEFMASCIIISKAGVFNTGNNSLGIIFVTGWNRVPRPAVGITALVINIHSYLCLYFY